MPAIANITVKKADGTTDIVYVAKTPASGDNTPAIWRAESVHATPIGQPELRFAARPNGNRTARTFNADYTYPKVYTDSNGQVLTTSRFNVKVTGQKPDQMTLTEAQEAGAQFGNLMAAALIKSCVADGFAPT